MRRGLPSETRVACLAISLLIASAVIPIRAQERPTPDAAVTLPATVRATLASLHLSRAGAPPPRPSNRVADDPAAATFGRLLFFDPRFSADEKTSCATCHRPELAFTDGKARAVGAAGEGRNTPTVLGAAWQSWFYWDGRRDSLWAQALIPFEAPEEMGSDRVAVVRAVASDADYSKRYEALFGPLPAPDFKRLPEHAGPFAGPERRRAWIRLNAGDRGTVDSIYANLGKAIEAYQRTLRYRPTRVDRHVDVVLGREAGPSPLSAEERLGLSLFVDTERTDCLRCHNGPHLTNGDFHNIGTGTFTGARLDLGRAVGLTAVRMDPFNCLGPFSDAEPEECSDLRFLNPDPHLPLEGAFKVPGLRELTRTGPYFHDGSKATLRDVIEHYRQPPFDPTHPHELRPLSLSDAEAEALVAFLRALSAEPMGDGEEAADGDAQSSP